MKDDRARAIAAVAPHVSSLKEKARALDAALEAAFDTPEHETEMRESGHATQAAANGASERSIMNQTGHRSLKMVRRYIRDGSLFRENAAARLGL